MKGKRATIAATAALCAFGMALAGCGSDSSTGADADEAPAALSKPQFVKQANQICAQGLKEKDQAVSESLKKSVAEGAGPPTPADVKKMVEEAVLPAYRDLIDQLDELGAPKGDEAKVEKLIAEFEAGMQSAEAEPVKASRKNVFKSADDAAEAYGLENCRL